MSFYRKTVLPLLAGINFLATLACSSDDSEEVTFHRDVRPILETKCSGCHNPDGIGPFDLLTFQDANVHGLRSLSAIKQDTMPPWKPENDCNQYKGNYDITEAETDVIEAWLNQGKKEGQESDYVVPDPLERPSLSRVDLELPMPVPYTMKNIADDYRCFPIEWPEETTTYVSGFEAIPGNTKTVHHVIAFLAGPGQRAVYQGFDDAEEGPGYTCFGGPGGPSNTWIGSWVPGSLGTDLPSGTGIKIEPGSTVVLQVHYNQLSGSPSAPDADLTALNFKLDSSVEKEGAIMPWANPAWLSGFMPIAANDPNATHGFSFDPTQNVLTDNEPLLIHNAGLHMHELGSAGKMSIERADGSVDCILEISDWDFRWQGDYQLLESMTLNPGDQLRIDCEWDNSAENQRVIDGQPLPPMNLNWGDGTQDEMCLGGFYWTM